MPKWPIPRTIEALRGFLGLTTYYHKFVKGYGGIALGLPHFSKPFLIECDASSEGIGAVLMQNRRPQAHLSQGLKGKNLSLSTYEKESLDLVMGIRKWRHYLLGQSFKV